MGKYGAIRGAQGRQCELALAGNCAVSSELDVAVVQLRRLRQERGWTLDDVVDGLHRLAGAQGEPIPGVDRQAVSRWERGAHRPRPHYVRLLSILYRASPAELGLVDHDTASPREVHGGWPERNASATSLPHRSRGYDRETIKGLIGTFRLIDNQFGGGHAYTFVTTQLDREIMPVMAAQLHGEHPPAALYATVAQLAHLAGWMGYDLGHTVRGRQYLNLANQLAIAGGDLTLAGEVMAGIAHQDIQHDEPDEAILLARAAQETARVTGSALLLSEGLVTEAQGHARRGDHRTCARLLHDAERSLDRARPEDEPDWLRYFDAAYLAARMAHCFRDVEQWDSAETYAKRSLEMDARFVRGRAFNLVLLATVRVRSDLDEALVAGREAVDLASGLQSYRARQYIADLQARMTQRVREPRVRQFNDYVEARLGAFTV